MAGRKRRAPASVTTPAPQMGPTSAGDAAAMAAADQMLGGPSATTPPGTDLSKAQEMAGPSGQDKANGGQMSELKKKDDESDEEYQERMEKMKGMQKSEGGTPGLQDIMAAAQRQQAADQAASAPAVQASAPAAAPQPAARAAVDVSEDALFKSFDAVMDVARGGAVDDSTDRRAELAERLSKGELSTDENAELQQLLKSELTSDDDTYDDDLSKSDDDTFAESVLADPDIQAGHVSQTEDGSAFDVSGYLARQAAFVGGALDSIKGDLGEQLTKSFGQINQFNLAFARANRALAGRVIEQGQVIGQQGELIKSLVDRLETVENAPQPRRGVPAAQALNKSMGAAGEPAGPTGDLDRGTVVRGLVTLQQQSQDGRAPCGQDITQATAHYETTGQIHPAMMGDVRKALS